MIRFLMVAVLLLGWVVASPASASTVIVEVEATSLDPSKYSDFTFSGIDQNNDDLLDYTSDTETLGKTIGADLREGKMTLPLIHTLKNANPTDQEIIKNIIQNPDFSEKDFNALKRLLDTYGGIRYTTDLAAKYVDVAKNALSIFAPSQTKDLLLMLADYTLSRNL